MKNPNLKHNQGENNPMFGRHHSDETKKLMSNIRKSKGSSFLQLEHLKKMREKNIGYKHSEETLKKMRSWQIGRKHSEETKRKIREKRLLQDMSFLKGRKLSEETKKKISIAHKGKISSCRGKEKPYMKGSNHWNWKGGINPINDTLRKSLEMKLVAEATFKRDNFTCKECGKIGGRLEAHHIKPFAYFPELRFALDNLITLCKDCHIKTDTYAGKIIKYKKIMNIIHHN